MAPAADVAPAQKLSAPLSNSPEKGGLSADQTNNFSFNSNHQISSFQAQLKATSLMTHNTVPVKASAPAKPTKHDCALSPSAKKTTPEVPSKGTWLRTEVGKEKELTYIPPVKIPEKFDSDLSLRAVKSTAQELFYKAAGLAAHHLSKSSFPEPEKVIEESRKIAFEKAQERFKKRGLPIPKDWADVDAAAATRGLLTHGQAQNVKLDPNTIIEHESDYDSPGKPKYKVSSWSSCWEEEKKLRRSGHYAKATGDQDQMDKELVAGRMYLGKGLIAGSVLAASPAGDTTIHDIYNYARGIGECRELNAATKRALIHKYVRDRLGDDQTLQYGIFSKDEKPVHTVGTRELLREKAGVCRHLAGILFGAYNAAGIETELHMNEHHTWVESYDDPARKCVVTIDPNSFLNYVELPGSRGGAYLKSDGTAVPLARKRSSTQVAQAE